MLQMLQRSVDISALSRSMSETSMTDAGALIRTFLNPLSVSPDPTVPSPTSSNTSRSVSTRSEQDIFNFDDKPPSSSSSQDNPNQDQDDTNLGGIIHTLVKHCTIEELKQLGDTFGFQCVDKTSKNQIFQYKGHRQTVTVYTQKSTVLMQPGGDEYPRTTIFNCRVKHLGIMLESVMSTEKTRPVFPIFEQAKRRRSSSNPRRRRKSSSPAPPSKKQRTQCWWDDMYEDYDPTAEEEKPLRRRTRSRSSSRRRRGSRMTSRDGRRSSNSRQHHRSHRRGYSSSSRRDSRRSRSSRSSRSRGDKGKSRRPSSSSGTSKHHSGKNYHCFSDKCNQTFQIKIF